MKYTVTAQATISLFATIEADSADEAMEKAEELDLPSLCYSCESQQGDAWQPSMDGEPQDIKVAKG